MRGQAVRHTVRLVVQPVLAGQRGVPVRHAAHIAAVGLLVARLAELTNARVFDGREDLVAAFRSVKGYN